MDIGFVLCCCLSDALVCYEWITPYCPFIFFISLVGGRDHVSSQSPGSFAVLTLYWHLLENFSFPIPGGNLWPCLLTTELLPSIFHSGIFITNQSLLMGLDPFLALIDTLLTGYSCYFFIIINFNLLAFSEFQILWFWINPIRWVWPVSLWGNIIWPLTPFLRSWFFYKSVGECLF